MPLPGLYFLTWARLHALGKHRFPAPSLFSSCPDGKGKQSTTRANSRTTGAAQTSPAHTHPFPPSGLGLQQDRAPVPPPCSQSGNQLPAPEDCYDKMFTVWLTSSSHRQKWGRPGGLFSPSSRVAGEFRGARKAPRKDGAIALSCSELQPGWVTRRSPHAKGSRQKLGLIFPPVLYF